MRLEEGLKNVILNLSSFFQEQNIPFVIVDALVPAVLIDLKQGNRSRYGSRTTRDVDCAIQINSWNEYDRIKQDMLADGFKEKEGTPEHRLFFEETPVDIIPCGGLLQDGALYWPQSKRRMKMRGFSELFDKAELVKISKGKSIPFAPLPLTVFIKIQAYLDRRNTGDIEDIFYILTHYEDIKMSERRFDIVGQDDLNYEIAGAFLLGRDLRRSIPSDLIKDMEPFLEMFNDPENPPVPEIARITYQKSEYIVSLISAFEKGCGGDR